MGIPTPTSNGNNPLKILCLSVLAFMSPLLIGNANGMDTPSHPMGIAPLATIPHGHWETLIPPGTRPLLTPRQQTAFLAELEGEPPPWQELQDVPGEEPGERLFDWNRKRDALREGHPLLDQRVAFLWTGILRRFVPEHQGFFVAMGPEFTFTEWGIIRFKPVGLPHSLIAVPPPSLIPFFQDKLATEKPIEIHILFIGRLVRDESLMYTFSHEEPDQGMIMPFVQIEDVRYAYNE